MQSSVQSVLRLIRYIALQPVLTGSLLTVLTYGPSPLRERFLKLLTSYTTIGPRGLRSTLQILVTLGVLRVANNSLSAMAANNWLLKSPKPWHWPSEIAVVTGGSGGIGRIIVEELTKHGITVVVMDMKPLPKTLELNQRLKYFSCDLTSASSVAEVTDTIRRTVGHPSILVNNAGIINSRPILDTSDEHLRRIFGVNLLALWTVTREFLPNMIQQNKGHVVTLASLASFVALGTSVDYSATKAGALAFHEGLGSELRHVYKAPGVITTVVHPYHVRTAMTGTEAYRYVRQQDNLLSAEDVALKVVEQILFKRGGQLIIPGRYNIAPALRAFPTWLQDLVRDITSKSLVAGV